MRIKSPVIGCITIQLQQLSTTYRYIVHVLHIEHVCSRCAILHIAATYAYKDYRALALSDTELISIKLLRNADLVVFDLCRVIGCSQALRG